MERTCHTDTSIGDVIAWGNQAITPTDEQLQVRGDEGRGASPDGLLAALYLQDSPRLKTCPPRPPSPLPRAQSKLGWGVALAKSSSYKGHEFSVHRTNVCYRWQSGGGGGRYWT